MHDLIVIGGGPAGLTATMYAIKKRLNVLLISQDLGGKTNYRLALPWIEDYQVIRGLEVVSKFRTELEYLEFTRQMEPVERVDKKGEGFIVSTRGGEELETSAVIVATGTQQQRLEVPGEREFMMRGLCYSALSYAPLFIDKETVVIGDGDLALRSAGELATVAKHVHLVSESDKPLESPIGQKLSSAENVTIMNGYRVIEILGDDYASEVVAVNEEGKKSKIHADGTFVEKNLVPNSKLVADLVDLDPQGRIIIDCGNNTSVPGVFAAGDVTNTYAEQVLVAVGEGAKAALSAYEYLLPKL